MISELPECYGRKLRTARKPHRCCECDGTIVVGEKYHYHHGVWEGRGEDFKVCTDCEELRRECDKDARYYEITPFGNLIESVSIGNGSFQKFIEIKRKRGAEVLKWMENKLTRAEEKKMSTTQPLKMAGVSLQKNK